jgi:L-ascorbate metabolism protein UlaG (beta-lactamase superfamily)
MVATARYMAGFARFLATKGSQERHDLQALGELEARALSLPAGLELEWLGVSGYRMEYERHTLLIDPYVSRVPLRALLARRAVLPDAKAIDRYVGTPPGPVGVLVGHTHFDHAVDAPAIARRLGCPALGSASLVALMRLHGAEELAVSVEPYHCYELGPFTVSFVPSRHSKLLLGLAVPAAGELTCEHLDGLGPYAYRCGDMYGIRVEVAGVSFFHQGSSELIEEAIREPADVFLAGVAGRGFTRDYWPRALRALSPHTVVPTHYDDFLRPLDADLGLVANVNLARVPDEISAVSRDVAVSALPLLGGGPR